MSREHFFSLEFFPPRDEESAQRLQKTTQEILVMKPGFISVTFGAGGSTQEGSIETVKMLQAQGVEAVPHLSCIGNRPEQILAILEQFKQMGVNRIVALRGDLPSGMGLLENGLRHASDLVALIREHYGDHFFIEVAAYPEMHPQAESPTADLENFITKVNAGANSAITQYFFIQTPILSSQIGYKLRGFIFLLCLGLCQSIIFPSLVVFHKCVVQKSLVGFV